MRFGGPSNNWDATSSVTLADGQWTAWNWGATTDKKRMALVSLTAAGNIFGARTADGT